MGVKILYIYMYICVCVRGRVCINYKLTQWNNKEKNMSFSLSDKTLKSTEDPQIHKDNRTIERKPLSEILLRPNYTLHILLRSRL
jgi:hypothetical protein